MGVNLSKGQRVSLDKNMTMALVGLGWDPNQYDGGYDFDLDASAFLLGKNGKVMRDEDFVFYGNQEARNGAVKSMGDDTSGGNSEDGDDEQIFIDLPIVFSITQAHTITHRVKSLFICAARLKVTQTAPLRAAI